jgi:hypothetical protein
MGTLMKEKSQNLAAKKAEYPVWQIWCSHRGGTSQVNNWPADLNDIPSWSAPCTDVFINYNAAKDGSRDTYMAPWDGELMKSFRSTLHDAKPGYKFHVVLRAAYKYYVPGGKAENKWSSVLRKWETVVSTDGIGHEYSSPLARCSLEIEPYKQVEMKFIDNGDGTMTDTTHKIMRMKTPPWREKLWDDANLYAKELELAGHKDWRLPTAAELNDLVMAVKADPDGNCEWFKKMGFGDMDCAAYWSGDPEESMERRRRRFRFSEAAIKSLKSPDGPNAIPVFLGMMPLIADN